MFLDRALIAMSMMAAAVLQQQAQAQQRASLDAWMGIRPGPGSRTVKARRAKAKRRNQQRHKLACRRAR